MAGTAGQAWLSSDGGMRLAICLGGQSPDAAVVIVLDYMQT